MTKSTKWVCAQQRLRSAWASAKLIRVFAVAKDPRLLHADSEDSDQTGLMPRLIWVFAGRTLILLVWSFRSSNTCWDSGLLGYNVLVMFVFSFSILITPWGKRGLATLLFRHFVTFKMNHVVRIPALVISLISAFLFAAWILEYLYCLYPKFQDSSWEGRFES